MNTTQQRVSEWECDKVEPSLYNIMRMIKVLGTTFEELTEGIDFDTDFDAERVRTKRH